MNGDRLTLRPEATAGIVRAMIEHNALYNGPLRLWYNGTHVSPRAAAKGPLPPVPPDRRRGAGPCRAGRRRRADPDVPRAAGANSGRSRRDVRLEINSLGQPDERLAHRAALVAHFEAHADRPRRGRAGAACTATRCASSTARTRRCSPWSRRRRKLIDFLGEAESLAHFAGGARGARRGGPGLPRQSAPGARHGLLQPDRVRVDHRPARRAGHGLRRRPLRRPVRAARRQADAGGRLRAWAWSGCCCCSTHVGVPVPRGRARCLRDRADAGARCRGDGRLSRRCARPASACCCMPAGGSMKAQFKRADASGARFALVFGADELARGEVGLKALRDPAQAQRSLPLAAGRPPGRPTCATHNPAFAHARHPLHGDPSRSRRAGTARPAEVLLEAVRQPDHLGADRRAGRLCRLERLELVAARPGRQGRRDVRRTRPRRTGRRRRAGRGASSPT